MTVIDDIIQKTRTELESRKAKIPVESFDIKGKSRSLSKAIKSNKTAVISEIKPASPTLGKIRDLNVPKTAREMEEGGACAISVLTEPFFFGGNLNNLTEVKKAVGIPVLRKDFIIDEYQLYEAKHYKADAVLLIVAALGDSTAGLLSKAKELGMEALVEVHTEEELESVKSDAEIIGINNRNLGDLTIDLETTKRLASKVPEGKLIISESGVKNKEDLMRVLGYGADAALIGTSLMKSRDIKGALSGLLK